MFWIWARRHGWRRTSGRQSRVMTFTMIRAYSEFGIALVLDPNRTTDSFAFTRPSCLTAALLATLAPRHLALTGARPTTSSPTTLQRWHVHRTFLSRRYIIRPPSTGKHRVQFLHHISGSKTGIFYTERESSNPIYGMLFRALKLETDVYHHRSQTRRAFCWSD